MGCFQLKNVTPLTLGVALLATAGWVAAFARQNPIIRTVCRKLAQFFRLLIYTTLVLLIKWIPVLVCECYIAAGSLRVRLCRGKHIDPFEFSDRGT